MFAGLPGIGVGTLFYVLTALWMPFYETAMVVSGRSSLARWRLIATQLVYAFSVVVSIMIADRVLMWVMGGMAPHAFSPARLLNRELGARAPHSIMAAPIVASIILLGGVLIIVEVSRMYHQVAKEMRSARPPAFKAEPVAIGKVVRD
jgi:hypothetical protein